MRSQRWRYIRYADGSEELYDHDVDPMEWKNLATAVEHTAVKEKLGAWLPKVNAPTKGQKAKKQERPRRQKKQKNGKRRKAE